jgi:pimeloyl-ACP methyl ester carboxylesterase
VDDYADTVDLWAQTLQLKQASLAGHSMGGAIAQTLALRQPIWLARLVLVGTGARLRVHPLILEGLRTDFETTIDTICRWAYGPSADNQVVRRGRQQLLRVDRTVIHGDYIACDAFELMDRVKDILLPTLIIGGSSDRMTPLKYGQYLHDHIPGSQLVEIKDGGHMMAIEKPVEVAQAVARFLEVPQGV